MILAKGKIAKKPYELSYLGQNIYSIEELCYVIYHNIYGINEEFFQISLAKWMKEELGLKELAEKLEANDCGGAWAERFGCYRHFAAVITTTKKKPRDC